MLRRRLTGLALCGLILLWPPALAQRLGFGASLYEVEEGESVTVTVVLSEAVDAEVSVFFETAAGSAAAERDFAPASGTLRFAPGETEQTFELTTLDDAKFEGNEALKVVLSAPTGADLSFLSDASLRILDDDPEPVGLLEDFEGGVTALALGDRAELIETTPGALLALPGQGAYEGVLQMREDGRLEASFATAQDWSAFGALRFWYYGQGTGERVEVTLSSGRGDPAAAQWPLLWSDEFSGPAGTPPDPNLWNYDLGGGGWGNGELQTYTDDPENAALDGSGHLVITAQELPEGNGSSCHYGECRYSSARLTTADKATLHYGRLEARMGLPEGQGLWPALWLLGDDFFRAGWPAAGEIDIMEYIGRESDRVHGHLHGPGYSGGAGPGGPFIDGAGFADFRVYTLEWEPDAIRWYVDGEPYLRLGPEDVNGEWVYDHPFFLLLNLAVGGGWPGAPDETTTFPQTLTVDYVRAYALPDTSARFSSSFTDDREGWREISLPFADFLRADAQPAGAPEGELGLGEIWSYGLELPGGSALDQVRLEPLR